MSIERANCFTGPKKAVDFCRTIKGLSVINTLQPRMNIFLRKGYKQFSVKIQTRDKLKGKPIQV